METERLYLLPWAAGDWIEFLPIAQDPAVMRYIGEGRPWAEERVRAYVERQMSCYEALGFCNWKLVDKSGGSLCGFCGIQPLTVGGADEIEIGWWLKVSHWGRGLATEAARAALRDGVERAGLPRIVAIAQAPNKASIHVMEKIGMRFERRLAHHGIEVVLYSFTNQPRRYITHATE